MKTKNQKDYRVRRHLRLRQKVQGTAERPRMSVFVSNRHMYVQLIDDGDAKTLASASTMDADMKEFEGKCSVDAAKKLGALIARTAMDKGIKVVVFDRGGFPFRGRVKAIADAAREAGLKI